MSARNKKLNPYHVHGELPNLPQSVQSMSRQEKDILGVLPLEFRRHTMLRGYVQSSATSGATAAELIEERAKRLTLVDIFSDYRFVFDFFCDFLQQSMAFENIAFLIDTAKFKRLIRSELATLIQNFVSHSSKYEVNITQESKEGLLDSIAKNKGVLETMFNTGEYEIISLLHSDTLPKFKQSKQFAQWIDYLIRCSTVTNEKDIPLWKRTPLLIQNDAPLDIIRDSLDEGGLVSDSDDEGQSCLHIAVLNRNYEVVDFLLKAGADGNMFDNRYRTPLHIAAGIPDLSLINKLLASGSSALSTTHQGVLPLHLFVTHKAYTGIKDTTRAQKAASVSVGLTTLELEEEPSTKRLSSKQKKKNIINQLKTTPKYQRRFSLQQTLSGEIDSNSPIRQTLMQLITAPENKQGIKTLINYKTKSGDTPLHYCCNAPAPYEGMLLLLLENGALVDAPNAAGDTPLHLLILNKNVPSATFLATINSLSENNFESKSNYISAPFKEMSCVISIPFIQSLLDKASTQTDPQKSKVEFLNELLQLTTHAEEDKA